MTSARAMVAARLANLTREDSRHAGNNCKFAVDSHTRAAAAEKLNVSERSVNTAKAVQREKAWQQLCRRQRKQKVVRIKKRLIKADG